MAVGDVISAINITSYQPSSGVEVILLHLWYNNSVDVYRLNNGTNDGYNYSGQRTANTSVYLSSQSTMKLPITNTNYYTSDGSSAISGIQIK